MIFWCAVLAVPVLFVVSCGSLDPQAMGPRFHEPKAANLVLIYYADQSIFITKPDTRENGFLPLLSRSDVIYSLKRLNMGLDLAVIVLGRMSAQDQADLMQKWEAILTGQGFQRVVFLAAGRYDDIDGLPILHDSAIARRDAEHAAYSASVASFTPAP